MNCKPPCKKNCKKKKFVKGYPKTRAQDFVHQWSKTIIYNNNI